LDSVNQLGLARQKNLLRYWLQQQGLRLPDSRQLHSLLEQLSAAGDSQPVLRLDQAQLYRSSGRLWLLPWPGVPAGIEQPLEALRDTRLLAGNGWLRFHGVAGPRLAGAWRIAYRRGGEQISLPGRPSQSLKNLFQT